MNTFMIFAAEYLVALAPLIVAWFVWKAHPDTRRKLLRYAIYLLPLAFLLSLAARSLYDNPRPFVVGGFEPLVAHTEDNGFPSDHTLFLAALAMLITLSDPKHRYAGVLWALTLLVGVARVYVGVHHGIDIIGSIAIALLAGLIVESALKRREQV